MLIKNPQCTSSSQRECEYIRSYVLNTLRSDTRINLLGFTESEAVKSEIELQKDEDFLEGKVADAWYSSDTDWYFSYRYVSSAKSFVSQIFDAQTNTLLDEERISIQLGFLSVIQDQKDELIQCIQRLLARQFPSFIPVIKSLNSSKTKVRELLIAGGTNHGIHVGQQLFIHAPETDSTDKATAHLATVEVWMVEGENFSRCFVTDGAKALFQALAQQQSLQVIIP